MSDPRKTQSVNIGGVMNTYITASLKNREDGFGKDLDVSITSRHDAGFSQNLSVWMVSKDDLIATGMMFLALAKEMSEK